MSDSEFKIINKDTLLDKNVIDNTLDNDNATKNCESSDSDDVSDKNEGIYGIYIDDNMYCCTDNNINIEKKMITIANNILSKHINSYDTEFNIYKKDDDIVITSRYRFFIISYESILHTISYSYTENYENIFKDL